MQNRTNLGKLLGLAAVASLMAIAAQTGNAQIFTTSGSIAGENISATATFSKDINGNLVVVLANTSVNGAGGTLTRTGVLTDLFWSINGANPTLTYVSANAPLVVQDGQANRANVNMKAELGG